MNQSSSNKRRSLRHVAWWVGTLLRSSAQWTTILITMQSSFRPRQTNIDINMNASSIQQALNTYISSQCPLFVRNCILTSQTLSKARCESPKVSTSVGSTVGRLPVPVTTLVRTRFLSYWAKNEPVLCLFYTKRQRNVARFYTPSWQSSSIPRWFIFLKYYIGAILRWFSHRTAR